MVRYIHSWTAVAAAVALTYIGLPTAHAEGWSLRIKGPGATRTRSFDQLVAHGGSLFAIQRGSIDEDRDILLGAGACGRGENVKWKPFRPAPPIRPNHLATTTDRFVVEPAGGQLAILVDGSKRWIRSKGLPDTYDLYVGGPALWAADFRDGHTKIFRSLDGGSTFDPFAELDGPEVKGCDGSGCLTMHLGDGDVATLAHVDATASREILTTQIDIPSVLATDRVIALLTNGSPPRTKVSFDGGATWRERSFENSTVGLDFVEGQLIAHDDVSVYTTQDGVSWHETRYDMLGKEAAESPVAICDGELLLMTVDGSVYAAVP